MTSSDFRRLSALWFCWHGHASSVMTVWRYERFCAGIVSELDPFNEWRVRATRVEL